jgi:hypothetical protein
MSSFSDSSSSLSESADYRTRFFWRRFRRPRVVMVSDVLVWVWVSPASWNSSSSVSWLSPSSLVSCWTESSSASSRLGSFLSLVGVISLLLTSSSSEKVSQTSRAAVLMSHRTLSWIASFLGCHAYAFEPWALRALQLLLAWMDQTLHQKHHSRYLRQRQLQVSPRGCGGCRWIWGYRTL